MGWPVIVVFVAAMSVETGAGASAACAKTKLPARNIAAIAVRIIGLTSPRHRQRARQPAVHRDRMAVDVGRLVARQEQRGRRDLFGVAIAAQRIELADLVVGAALAGAVEDRLGHAGLDDAGADRIDAHARAVEK